MNNSKIKSRLNNFTRTILIIFFSFAIYAQDVDEDFLNEIISIEKVQNYDSILLLVEKSDLLLRAEIVKELKSIMPNKIVDELSIKNKAVRIKKKLWDVSKVDRAKRVISKDSLGILIYKDYHTSDSLFKITYHLDSISDLEILDKKIDSLDKIGINAIGFRSLSSCHKYTSIYSYPLFSKNGKWAIIEQVRYIGALNASGAIYIYKKKRKKWKLIDTAGGWIS